MNKIEENIAEIALYVGSMMSNGDIDKQELDISSTEMCEEIVKWGSEFEVNYGDTDLFQEEGVIDGLGNVFGYLDAIDKFTDIKVKEVGWVK
ncbi:hypothetical protein [Paenibacillus tianjinensis]|uniref:Uncharacterized protein n=1 Tax=Paenibacillus tianjinensis TaxID=2810347 RepID=A0ABX7L825_9BACL|nr:hypothetical protein [Paenibacillus tianjinensis]QSF43496.1 hypothetical protein JRJ22_19730 [Paenibacillus tianjinensis]